MKSGYGRRNHLALSGTHGGKHVFPSEIFVAILISWTPKSLQVVTATMKLEDTCSLEGKL